MSDSTPRLRMFAGPNGSGKTTVKTNLGKPPEWFGVYINPDELEASIRQTGMLDTTALGQLVSTENVRDYFTSSSFLIGQGLAEGCRGIVCEPGRIDFRSVPFNSYHASVLADFLRRQLMEAGRSFTFETVMSASDKVRLLGEAQSKGFRTYLYYIATEDPAINIARVKNRVVEGGHDVPQVKIVERYRRSLALLPQAIRASHRAYLFDTSEEEAWYFAEITDGTRVELKSGEMPGWFEPIWNQFDSAL